MPGSSSPNVYRMQDIIAKIMNKFFRIDLGKAMGMAGMAVALSSALAYDSKTVVISVLGTYFSGIVLDHMIFGSTIKKRVCIISKKREEILHFILHPSVFLLFYFNFNLIHQVSMSMSRKILS